jgi:diguanylate cyclase (GGDEF)-like protein
VDRFKQFNDAYGHKLGDEVLAAVAQVMKSAIRQFDQVVRYGGDEFVIVLPNAELEAANQVGDRVREGVGNISLESDSGDPIGISISIGCACHSKQTPYPSLEALCHAADTELYKFKHARRQLDSTDEAEGATEAGILGTGGEAVRRLL